MRFSKDDLVVAALRFSTREYNGQVYQDIMVNEIIKVMSSELPSGQQLITHNS